MTGVQNRFHINEDLSGDDQEDKSYISYNISILCTCEMSCAFE